MINKKAFTLAELLITLGVVGIVAAVTIPVLITNYQKSVTVVRLKQTYTILNEAVKKSEIVNGSVEGWNDCYIEGFNIETYNCGKLFAEKYLTPYMNVVKRCEHASTDCVSEKAYNLDGSTDTFRNASSAHTYNFVLSNGVVLGVWPRTNFVEIYVDINGKSSPNKRARDQFYTLLVKKPFNSGIFGNITHSGVWFYGQGYNREYLRKSGYPCAKTGALAGTYCGALIMLDGWKISPDYPW